MPLFCTLFLQVAAVLVQVQAAEDEDKEVSGLGEPGGLQQQEEEHATGVKGVKCPLVALVLAESGSKYLRGAFPDSRALDPFQK